MAGIIVGAGAGQRFGGKDKALLPLCGKPLLAWSVDTCQKCTLIQELVLVVRAESVGLVKKLALERGWTKVVEVCPGGELRQDSVAVGIKRLRHGDWVLIHDAARPFLNFDLIQRGLEAALETGCSVAAVPVKDTIKVSDERWFVAETLPRQQLWAVQTPQVFCFHIIKRAYQKVDKVVTDDASLVEQLGYRVKIYRGSEENIKITTPQDLALAELIVSRAEKRCALV